MPAGPQIDDARRQFRTKKRPERYLLKGNGARVGVHGHRVLTTGDALPNRSVASHRLMRGFGLILGCRLVP